MLRELFPQLWLPALKCQIKFLELPAQVEVQDEDILKADLDGAGFQASFVKLVTTIPKSVDPWVDLPEPRIYFVEQMNRLLKSEAHIHQAILSLPTDAQTVLKSYGIAL